MTRLWPNGDAIVVESDLTGRPLRLNWKGAVHKVNEVTNFWRVDDSWWEQRIWRDYFTVTTQTELLLTIYCDRVSGEWFVERLYD